jgi:hypothetical protein
MKPYLKSVLEEYCAEATRQLKSTSKTLTQSGLKPSLHIQQNLIFIKWGQK